MAQKTLTMTMNNFSARFTPLGFFTLRLFLAAAGLVGGVAAAEPQGSPAQAREQVQGQEQARDPAQAQVRDAAHAQVRDPAQALWLESGFWSHHTHDRPDGKPYNERNTGIGLEWQFAPRWQLNAGQYRNSGYRSSNYLQVGWSPLQWPVSDGLTLSAGLSLGVVNGYPNISRSYFPTLVPMTSLEWRRVGVNLVYIPSVGRINGAFAAQLKVRIF